jgi:phosphate transport system substrate-binding protein
MKKILYLLLAIIWTSLLACQPQKEKNENKTNKYDTPTSGEISVAVDEAFLPIAQQEANAFMNEYEKTKINIITLPEDKAIQLMLRDSVDAVIVGRNLNSNEKKEIERQKTIVRDWVQAYDAVAVVVNKDVKNTALSFEQLKSIFSGNIKNWKQLNPDNQDSEIAIIIDNANSSNYNFINNKLEVSDISKLKIYAAKSNKAIVEQVAKNKNALGLVAFHWLEKSDLSKVRILAIRGEKEEILPSQSSFAQNTYPLRRECFMLVKNRRFGLAYAFAAFVSQEIGQRIVLKSGLLPAKIPPREIEMISE